LDVTASVAENSPLLFCIPENKDLLNYWDRVEDRLFKIRNCMNISGVRRTLALFQPPIDPMLLVKAKSMGLALEDILRPLPTLVPLYRFTYLVEKAKQFTQTVQNFGSALLGALEKKDTEELILLRSVHERNILNIMKLVKNKQIEDAIAQYQAAIEARTNLQNRIDHYTNLIDNGLSTAEIVQETSKHLATALRAKGNLMRLLAAIMYLIPQFGSPLAMKFGGKEWGDSAGHGQAEAIDTAAKILESVSESAGIRANFQRREEEWNHQLKLATQELKQMDNQVLASDIRVKIAEKEIENHNKDIEQTNELDEFYKNKFTNLGLYNYLSTSMSRLYREAYNLAYDMAINAEQAYIFEQDNETGPFIAQDNWRFDRAGLLAGERLILQLQRMEKTYMDNNKRENEITQSFSLAIMNRLTELKEKGMCNFDIPEIMFDLFYPGQYKRLIKSVRITIPCVTGPYTNISARLSLLNYSVREEPNLDNPISHFGNTRISTTSISTSSAQNDTGTFEFSFRDERYLPFEGAGAISEWELKLPSIIRSFDYNTISDVIIHVSYTAKDGDGFRDTVEGKIHDILKDFALSNGLYRLVSLKHDFPSAFYKLLNPAVQGGKQVTEFVIGKNYFPYFLSKEGLTLSSSTTIYLKSKGEDHVNTNNLTLKVNDVTINSGSWTSFTETIKQSILNLTGKPDKTWTIDAGVDGFDKEELDDILILMQYKIQ
jgi:Tc toxin complex TcA C-terminal TcB-binding domain